EARRAVGTGIGSADLPADGCHGRRPDGAGVRTNRKRMGTARFPAALDRVLPEGSAPWTRGGRWPRRLPQDDGCLVLVVPANGPSGRAFDEEWRNHVHHDLLRQPDGG